MNVAGRVPAVISGGFTVRSAGITFTNGALSISVFSRGQDNRGYVNAETREEVVNYYITLPKDSIKSGVEFMASALKSPLFRSDELESERAVVIGARRLKRPLAGS